MKDNDIGFLGADRSELEEHGGVVRFANTLKEDLLRLESNSEVSSDESQARLDGWLKAFNNTAGPIIYPNYGKSPLQRVEDYLKDNK